MCLNVLEFCLLLYHVYSKSIPKPSHERRVSAKVLKYTIIHRFLFPGSCHPLTQHSDLGRRSLRNYKPNASEQSNEAADLLLGDTFLLHPTHGCPKIQIAWIILVNVSQFQSIHAPIGHGSKELCTTKPEPVLI